jgi:hypothetical protein
LPPRVKDSDQGREVLEPQALAGVSPGQTPEPLMLNFLNQSLRY